MIDLACQFPHFFGESRQAGERRPVVALPLSFDQMIYLVLHITQCAHSILL